MDTISPVHADAFRLLSMNLYAHLCEAEDLASRADEWSDEDRDSVRRLIPGLLVAIRGLLIAHEVTPQRQLPDLLVGLALPGSDDTSRADQGPRP